MHDRFCLVQIYAFLLTCTVSLNETSSQIRVMPNDDDRYSGTQNPVSCLMALPPLSLRKKGTLLHLFLLRHDMVSLTGLNTPIILPARVRTRTIGPSVPIAGHSQHHGFHVWGNAFNAFTPCVESVMYICHPQEMQRDIQKKLFYREFLFHHPGLDSETHFQMTRLVFQTIGGAVGDEKIIALAAELHVLCTIGFQGRCA